MSANQYLSPPQFKASAAKKSATPPVTPPTTAPVSSGGSMNAASMWSFTKASQTAANQSGN